MEALLKAIEDHDAIAANVIINDNASDSFPFYSFYCQAIDLAREQTDDAMLLLLLTSKHCPVDPKNVLRA
jgi:hypothetical protein